MIFSVVHFVLGLALILRPKWFAGISEGRRRRRLAALTDGAPEQFFEEKRSLETYPPRRGGLVLWRLLGVAMIASAILLGAREARADEQQPTLANAAKAFGIDGPACADRRAPLIALTLIARMPQP